MGVLTAETMHTSFSDLDAEEKRRRVRCARRILITQQSRAGTDEPIAFWLFSLLQRENGPSEDMLPKGVKDWDVRTNEGCKNSKITH